MDEGANRTMGPEKTVLTKSLKLGVEAMKEKRWGKDNREPGNRSFESDDLGKGRSIEASSRYWRLGS